MTDPIDQLKEWWENAEDAPASPGDRIIERHVCERDEDTYYTVGVHREGMSGLIGKSSTRILHRAPKPAWHDAVAVVARSANAPAGHREPFIRSEATPGVWIGEGGYGYSDDLRDVTPLIEAKVTDEQARKALTAYYEDTPGETGWHDDTVTQMRLAIADALGIETEGSSQLQEESNDH